MIRYTIRLLASVIRALPESPLHHLDESVVTMRVWPADLDTFGHMNNGRYLTLMDLGRNNIAIRSGLAKLWLKRKWSPLLGGATIRYRRPLEPFQRYELRTRILCWDDKWFYLEQRFTRGADVYAVAIVKALLMGPEGKVPPVEIFTSLDPAAESPPMPDVVARWNEAEAALTTS